MFKWQRKGTNDRNRWQKQFPLFFLTSCGNENTRLSHKSSSKIFSSAKRELDIFMFSVSIRWQSERLRDLLSEPETRSEWLWESLREYTRSYFCNCKFIQLVANVQVTDKSKSKITRNFTIFGVNEDIDWRLKGILRIIAFFLIPCLLCD